MSTPAITAPRRESPPAGGCSCDPPWPLLYTTTGRRWRQVFPAPAGRTGGVRCLGCGAPYPGPWRPRPT